MEVIELQSNIALKSIDSTNVDIWSHVPKEKYPIMRTIALKIKSLFSSTYLCESSFSHMKFIKNKYRSRMTDAHLQNCIRMAVTNYPPNIEIIFSHIGQQGCKILYPRL
uniref:EPM2A-interacting protein 1 n=1 Tax=Cacopsylla melanoneura TaxID=428564 RepID=A0A8D8VSJ7_9HEMI